MASHGRRRVFTPVSSKGGAIHARHSSAGGTKIRAYLALMVAATLIPVILFSTISLNMLLRAERDAAF